MMKLLLASLALVCRPGIGRCRSGQAAAQAGCGRAHDRRQCGVRRAIEDRHRAGGGRHQTRQAA